MILNESKFYGERSVRQLNAEWVGSLNKVFLKKKKRMASTLRKREEKKYPSFSRDLNKLASQTRWTFLSFSGQMIHPYFSFSQLDAGTALVPTNLLLRPVHLFSTPHRTFLIPALFRDKTAAAEPAITQDRKPHLFFSIGLAVRVRVWCYVVSYSYVPLLLPSSYGEFQHEKEKKEENNFFFDDDDDDEGWRSEFHVLFLTRLCRFSSPSNEWNWFCRQIIEIGGDLPVDRNTVSSTEHRMRRSR